ncbi:uncharacterized protein LACBIDRAFT_330335 [Laccaria bicolor S238N-H82]|uniref:Predicted protein n=1 Tax=Laccaria bicolor (strain S238N-H82 / ATCC MYA-4686) TaxID=486041 RepID=B0DKZ0_LACBS|nr:uncharacterized protein LACBIDRAFT_330335 [Laccaria bicolor S238N-H82]EDR04733.1 predicted protein [Laccaria bicolor S238N-H82]|eukprot:XP_001884557.1 predicted protein [Laccaria bicolor S238N-H82]
MMENVNLPTFIVLFERESFVIAGTPRIIVPKHPSRHLRKIKFIPIKGNRILLLATYSGGTTYHLLSIYEIRSDNRIGPILWSFNSSHVDAYFDIFGLELIKSTKNALGISFGKRFNDHWKLFDISTTGTDALDDFPLIESGRIDFDPKPKSKREFERNLTKLSPDRHILLNVDYDPYKRHSETIDIHHSDSGGTNNMDFSFITRMSIPIPRVSKTFENSPPSITFSADGSKFAMSMGHGRVSAWDIRNIEVPLKTCMDSVPKSNSYGAGYLQFSSGKLGKEVLVFVESLAFIHVIDATSFETEEILPVKLKYGLAVCALFFDPSGETLYVEVIGTLYEWDLRKNETGPEWWIGEDLRGFKQKKREGEETEIGLTSVQKPVAEAGVAGAGTTADGKGGGRTPQTGGRIWGLGAGIRFSTVQLSLQLKLAPSASDVISLYLHLTATPPLSNFSEPYGGAMLQELHVVRRELRRSRTPLSQFPISQPKHAPHPTLRLLLPMAVRLGLSTVRANVDYARKS